MEYKSVKIPEWAYMNALAARTDLLRRGLDAIPEEVREPQSCPRCGSKMEPLADAPGVECAAGCGYRQDRIDAGEGVGLGVLLGLGLAALLERLPNKEQSRPTPAQVKARAAIAEIRRKAKAHGLDKMTEEEIEAGIQAARRDRRAKKRVAHA
jgi:hypothetical protein